MASVADLLAAFRGSPERPQFITGEDGVTKLRSPKTATYGAADPRLLAGMAAGGAGLAGLFGAVQRGAEDFLGSPIGGAVPARAETPPELQQQLQENAWTPGDVARFALEGTPVLGDAVQAERTLDAEGWGKAYEGALLGLGLLPAIGGMTVWHGSPHLFDRFDLSKIGTGEGAQAYGHGLYFAENPDVARHYSDIERMDLMDPSGQRWSAPRDDEDAGVAEMFLRGAMGNYASAARDLRGRAAAVPRYAEPYLGALAALEKMQEAGIELTRRGTPMLYEVDLPDPDIARMLDWDRPLRDQPETVRSALGQLDLSDQFVSSNVRRMQPGQEMYRALSQRLGGDAKASMFLNELGVPGVRYLDGNSRGRGAGTSNFVAFDDDLPTILSRNGEPLKRNP